MYYVENDPAANDDITHVVARTTGANRKYFYRCHGKYGWTPWEQIKLDIDDDSVIPVVWNGRLLLFWLRFLNQAPLTTPPEQPANKKLIELNASEVIRSQTPLFTITAILCWSEYYDGKWQPTKTSDINHPAELGSALPTFDYRLELEYFAFEEEVEEGKSGVLGVFINAANSALLGWETFRLFNTHSLPVAGGGGPPLLYACHYAAFRQDLLISSMRSIGPSPRSG
jgi:hypothetical protein